MNPTTSTTHSPPPSRKGTACDFVNRKGYLTEIQPNAAGLAEARIGDRAYLVCDDLHGPYRMRLGRHDFNLDMRQLRPAGAREGCVILQTDLRSETPRVHCKGYYQMKNSQYKRTSTPLPSWGSQPPLKDKAKGVGALPELKKQVPVSRAGHVQRKQAKYEPAPGGQAIRAQAPGPHPLRLIPAAADFVARHGYLTELKPDASGAMEALISKDGKAHLVGGDLQGQYVMIVQDQDHEPTCFNLDMDTIRPDNADDGCVILQTDLTGPAPQITCQGYYRLPDGTHRERPPTPVPRVEESAPPLPELQPLPGEAFAAERHGQTLRQGYIERLKAQYGEAILSEQATAPQGQEAHYTTLSVKPQTGGLVGSLVNTVGHFLGFNTKDPAKANAIVPAAPLEDPNSRRIENLDFQALQDDFVNAARKDLEYLKGLEKQARGERRPFRDWVPKPISARGQAKLDWYRNLQGQPLRLTMGRLLAYDYGPDAAGKVQYKVGSYNGLTCLSPQLDIDLHGVYQTESGYLMGYGPRKYIGGDYLKDSPEKDKAAALPNLRRWELKYDPHTLKDGNQIWVSHAEKAPVLRITRPLETTPASGHTPQPQPPETQAGPSHAAACATNALTAVQPKSRHEWKDARTHCTGPTHPDALLLPPENPNGEHGCQQYSIHQPAHDEQRYQLRQLLNDAARLKIPASFELRYRLEGQRLVAHELRVLVPPSIAYGQDDDPKRKTIRAFMEHWFLKYQDLGRPLDLVMEADITEAAFNARKPTPVPATPASQAQPASASTGETPQEAKPPSLDQMVSQLTPEQRLAMLTTVSLTPYQLQTILDAATVSEAQEEAAVSAARLTARQVRNLKSPTATEPLTPEQQRDALNAAQLTPEQQQAALTALLARLTPEQQQAALAAAQPQEERPS